MRFYLLFGSNIGKKHMNIEEAIIRLKEKGLKEFARSRLYESIPWGYRPQPRFLNQVVGFETHLSPTQLLREIKIIENKVGRIHTRRWGVRKIDVDILLAEGREFASKDLKIPHPMLQERIFAILPLTELLPRSFNSIRIRDRGKAWIVT